MSEAKVKVRLNIDNKYYQVDKGITILQAAKQHDIYIPTLCAHKDLTPYGGCRMCLVEVEGARGFLTSCTTPVENGMVIRTHTDQVQKERREILELILSEHTSSCLVCDERVECRNSMGTIRKVGVTTGCRFCPNDDQCELEKVVTWLGIEDINHPVSYRNLPVERIDPFYDRDYNICILCGRCVRVCQEVRNANVLAFNQRGRQTVIGPAFGRTHLEAGCEFCGTCVSICPTGTLAERSNKWDGKHEREEITTCALCGVGCQMRLLIKGNKIIGTEPHEDDLVNAGQLCVKGRFCVYEMVNHHKRLKKPVKKLKSNINLDIGWDEAIEIAAEKLSACPPEKFAMIVSPNCSNEDIYVAQKFTRVAMESGNIDSSARLHYGVAFNGYLELLKKSTPISEIDNASVVLAIGLDMKYGRSVVGVKVRKAVQRGAKIVTIHPRQHSLGLSADAWLQPSPGGESGYIRSITEGLTKRKKTGNKSDPLVAKIIDFLSTAKRVVILIGPEILDSGNVSTVLNDINQLAEIIHAGVVPLPAFNNLYGSLLMGSYAECLPNALKKKSIEDIWGCKLPSGDATWNSSENRKLNTAYLIGHIPSGGASLADFTIYQNIYPMNGQGTADLYLPAAAFTEIDGSFINGEGRIQKVRKGVDPPGEVLPDWKILCLIARKLGKRGFDFKNVSQIRKEIAVIVPGFNKNSRKANPLPTEISLNNIKLRSGGKSKAAQGSSVSMSAEHVYRGISIADKVEGFKRLVS